MTSFDQNTWVKTHEKYLENQLHWVRLLAERHIRWLQHRGPETDQSGSQEAVGSPSGVDDAMSPSEFFLVDEAAQSLGEEIAAHQRRAQELDVEMRSLGALSGIAALSDTLYMSALESDAVMMALAAELDPSVGALFATIHDDARLRSATVALVSALLSASPTEGAELLDSESSSQRFRVFEPVSSTEPAVRRPLRLDGRMISYLRGHNHPDERMAGILTPMHPLPLVETHSQLSRQLHQWLTEGVGDQVSHINLTGRAGQGREAVAISLITSLGFHPLRLQLDRLVGRPDRLELLRLIEREAALLPAGIYVDAFESSGEDPSRLVIGRELIEDIGGLVVIGTEDRWDGREPLTSIRVPPLSSADRIGLWKQVLTEQEATEIDLDSFIQQFALGPEGVVQVAAEAKARAELSGAQERLNTEGLWGAARTFIGADLGQLAQRIDPMATWTELVLPANDYELLQELAGQVRHRSRVYEEWGFGDRLARGRGISALFAGPSGTGKTMAAEIIAGELNLDLYRIDLSSVVSKYIGETEKNLRIVFDAADQGGAILFFDEADALFGKRSEVKDSHDRHANVEINYLLQRMEDFAGLAILATNRKADLDPAFLRRLRFVVSFPFPKASYRRRIWESVFPADLPRADLDFDALARLEIAGGNIRTIAVNAAFQAAAAQESLGMSHLMKAAGHEFKKLDRLPSEGEFGRYYDEVRP